MRHGLLVLALVPGCLYLGGINHAPEGTLTVVTLEPKLHEVIQVKADVSDEEGDAVRYRWHVVITDDDGNTLRELDLADEAFGDGGTSFGGIRPVGDSLEQVAFDASFRGHYAVEVVVEDEQGAQQTLTTSVEVKNQPPSIGLLLDVDPAHKLTDNFPDSAVASASPRYPVHAHLVLGLKQTETSDYEDDVTCGGSANIAFELLQPSEQDTEYWQRVPCVAGELADRLRFRLDPSKVTQPVTLKIKVTVDDGHGGSVSEVLSMPLSPNRPACIKGADGTDPPVAPQDSDFKAEVTASEGRQFEVRFTDDDVLDGIRLSWWVRDKGATDFVSVQQGIVDGGFHMPAWFRMPGDEIELRVVAADPLLGGALPGCPVSQELCREPMAALPTDCYQWVTWRVLFR